MMVQLYGIGGRLSITRPADTTAYLAGDVVGGAQEFKGFAPSGLRVRISYSTLLVRAAALISGESNYRLHLYDITPPSALADNDPWDLPAGDRDNYLGALNLGTPVDEGASLWVEAEQAKDITLQTDSLFVYLETIGAFTPASETVRNIALEGFVR